MQFARELRGEREVLTLGRFSFLIRKLSIYSTEVVPICIETRLNDLNVVVDEAVGDLRACV